MAIWAAVIVSPLLTVTPEWVSVPPARLRLVIWTQTSASLSTSVKVKSPLAKLSGVSSLVLTVLTVATGTSLTGVTSMSMVAATAPLPPSLTVKSNVANGQAVLVVGRRVDQVGDLGGGDRIAVVDRHAAVGERAAGQVEVGDWALTSASLSTSVKVKSPRGEVERGVFVGADRVDGGHRDVVDGVTSIFMVRRHGAAATSLTVKSNVATTSRSGWPGACRPGYRSGRR